MQYFTIKSRPTSMIHCNVICSCIYSATPLQTQCTAFFGNTLFFWTHCIASDYIIIQPPALQSKVESYQWFIALLWLGPLEFILTSVTPQKPGAGVMMMTNGMMMTSRGKYIDPPLDGSDPSKSPLYLRWRVLTLYSSHEIQALSVKYLLKHISHWWRKPITIISNYYLIA